MDELENINFLFLISVCNTISISTHDGTNEDKACKIFQTMYYYYDSGMRENNRILI